ncbi:MAG: PrsW family glutamic-type intramembrane protease [Planctomycetota bacterium]|jgi:DNA-directed RNA polymerase subunit RPC12/RpoP
MSTNDSIDNEPHRQPGPKPIDPSEKKTDKTLRPKNKISKTTYHDHESIYDEPDIFPGRSAELINQDWSCSNCGYNLRSLPTGHLCPECGHREWYRPPPPDADSYQMWLKERLAQASAGTGWFVVLIAAVVGGLMAIITSLLGTQQPGLAGLSTLTMAVVFAPAMEETMKIATTAIIIEVRPYLIRRIEQLQVATIGAAFIFAAIENLIYLHVYFPHHSTEQFVWRWTVCVILHVGCTMVASRGLIEVWKQTVTEYRRPKISRGLPMLITAIIIHGSYNACAFLYKYVT